MLSMPGMAFAQTSAGVTGLHEPFAGSETEAYLRFLQATSSQRSQQWSIRAHTATELDKIVSGLDSVRRDPWRRRIADRGTRYIMPLIPVLGMRFNSGVPYGVEDGAVWAGRGMTFVAQGGVDARWGPIALTLAPVFFRAQNARLPIRRLPSDSAVSVFADGVWPYNIDRPQRFGDGAYARLDPGQSSLRVDVGWFSAGASTANEAWGPGTRFGYVLTSQAAGIPRLFAGTSHALPLGIGRVHARVFWGQLQQSAYSPAADSVALRYATGGAVVFQPRGLPGLELGAARFFHERWPRGGFSHANFAAPFEALFKSSLPDDSLGRAGYTKFSNQIASVFARWAVRGAEVFGEVGREDHAFDRRDLIVEPDHLGSIMAGVQRSWLAPDGALSGLKLEWVSYRMTGVARKRGGGSTYLHGDFPQGHTQRGQLLGADAGVGNGSGLDLVHTRYSTGGRRRIHLARTLRYDRGNYWETGVEVDRVDVMYAAGYDRLFFMSRSDVGFGLTALANLGRDFTRDVFSLQVIGSFRPHFR